MRDSLCHNLRRYGAISLFLLASHAHAEDCRDPLLGYVGDVYRRAAQRTDFQLEHIGQAVALAWSADSKYLGLSTQNGTLLVFWDAPANKVLRAHRTGPIYSSAIAVLSNPPRIVFTSDTGLIPPGRKMPSSTISLAIWDMTLGRLSMRLIGSGVGSAFDVSSDGNHLVVADGIVDPEAIVFDLKTGKTEYSVPLPGPAYSIKCFADCHGWIAGGLDGELFKYNPGQSTAAEMDSPFHIKLAAGGEIKGAVYAVDSNSEGSLIAAALGIFSEGLSRKSDRSLDTRFDQKGADSAVQALPAVVIIKSRSDSSDLGQSGCQLKYLSTHDTPVRGMSWDRRRNIIVIVDDHKKLVLLSSRMGRGSAEQVEFGEPVYLATVSPDGARLALALADRVELYSLKD